MTHDAYVESVREFIIKLRGANALPSRPTLPSNGVALLRLRLMMEELGELAAAMNDQNLTHVADGLADLLYVVFGTALSYGIPIAEVFAEVHRSNMTKDLSSSVGPTAKGGVKGRCYSPPNLRFLTRFRHQLKSSTKVLVKN